MTPEQRQAVLQTLVQILHDNAGNRITLSLINGVSVTLGQFLDTLIVALRDAGGDNTGDKE